MPKRPPARTPKRDTTPPSEGSGAPIALAPASHRVMHSSVRSAIREFAIIVAGVLGALAANSWWDGRKDMARETAYVRQLGADLVAMRADLDTAIAHEVRAQKRTSRMNQFLRSTGDLPPADSLRLWSGGRIAGTFTPVRGTLTALVGSGDVRLVGDDSLRTAIITYAGLMDARLDALGRTREVFLQRSSRTRQALEPYLIYAPTRWQDTTVDVNAYRADMMRRSPELRTAFVDLETSYRTEAGTLVSIRNGTVSLLALLERRLAAKGSGR